MVPPSGSVLVEDFSDWSSMSLDLGQYCRREFNFTFFASITTVTA
jgi:hypothetical protein